MGSKLAVVTVLCPQLSTGSTEENSKLSPHDQKIVGLDVKQQHKQNFLIQDSSYQIFFIHLRYMSLFFCIEYLRTSMI